MPTVTALDKAVDDAVVSETSTQTEVPKEEVKTEETKEETKIEEPKVEQRQYTEDEQAAINLYNALKDPVVGPSVAFELAKKAGVLGSKEGKSTEEITKATVDILKEGVPPEYQFLVDGLAKGIEKIIQVEVDKRVAPLKSTVEVQLEKTVTREVDATFEKFYASHKDWEQYDAEMKEISKRLPMGQETDLATYLNDLYDLASMRTKEAKIVSKTVEKINKNAKEVRETSTGGEPKEVKFGSKLPSLDEALRAGFRGEKLI